MVPDPFAGARGRHQQDMRLAVVRQEAPPVPPEHHPMRAQESGLAHFPRRGPARGAVGCRGRLPSAPRQPEAPEERRRDEHARHTSV